MATIKIQNNEYNLEFTFAAAEHKDLVQSMFNVMSGAYIVRNGMHTEKEESSNAAAAMIDGAAEMVADIPRICGIAFYAGLLENNSVSEEEARELMKKYMKENKLSFYRLFEDLKKYMEDDGFFDLAGLTEMLQKMNSAAEEQVEKIQKAKTGKKTVSTK